MLLNIIFGNGIGGINIFLEYCVIICLKVIKLFVVYFMVYVFIMKKVLYKFW